MWIEFVGFEEIWHEEFSLEHSSFIAFHWAGFTVAQRERVQEDFNVPFKGAPPHPTPHSCTKDSHSTGITPLFSNSAWVLLRPTELSTFKELSLSSLSEKPRKSDQLQMKFQRQQFRLSYLKTLSVGPVGVSSQPGSQPSEPPAHSYQESKVQAGC